MKNILSFKPGTKILGSEIREWFEYHSNHRTPRSKMALFMKKHFENINNERYYVISFSYSGTECGKIVRKKPLLFKV